jgi:hypothetical protein
MSCISKNKKNFPNARNLVFPGSGALITKPFGIDAFAAETSGPCVLNMNELERRSGPMGSYPHSGEGGYF